MAQSLILPELFRPPLFKGLSSKTGFFTHPTEKQYHRFLADYPTLTGEKGWLQITIPVYVASEFKPFGVDMNTLLGSVSELYLQYGIVVDWAIGGSR